MTTENTDANEALLQQFDKTLAAAHGIKTHMMGNPPRFINAATSRMASRLMIDILATLSWVSFQIKQDVEIRELPNEHDA